MKRVRRIFYYFYNKTMKVKYVIGKPLRERRQKQIAIAKKEKRTFISYIPQIHSRMLIDPDSFLSSRVFVNRSYEPDLVHYLKRVLRPGMICVDAGANVGYLSMLMAKKVGRMGRVVSFEPTQRSFAALCRNIQLNGLTNVTGEQVALSDHNGTLEFHEGPLDYDVYNSAGNISHPSALSVTFKSTIVPCMTLDSYLNANNIEKVDLIKIDVEGGELSALKGMEETLERNPQALLIIEFADQTTRGFGYQAREIGFWLEAKSWKLSIIETLGLTVPASAARDWNGEIVVAIKPKRHSE